MSDNNTAETNYSGSFEERVFARFDAMDKRFDAIDRRFDAIESRLDAVEEHLGDLENRVGKLQVKQYDTKPIWEQALHEISQTNNRVEQLVTAIEQLRSEMKLEFATFREEIDDSLHEVGWKIDALNNNFLKIQADQRYTEKRIRDIESRSDPT